MKRDILIGPGVDLSDLSENARGEVSTFADYIRRTAAAESAGVPRDEAARAIYPDVYAWTCHAKPAATGKTCGHVNAAGIHHNGNLCCEACGCTKTASDAREKT